MPTPPRDVTVIGSGIVGLACAMSLMRDGHRITLIDPRPPGSATSFGNAGAVVTGGVVPTSTPGLWRKVPRMLFDPMSPLKVRWRYMPQLAPWLIRFLRAGQRETAIRTADELWPLTSRAAAAHKQLAREAGAEDLLRPVGWLKVYRNQAGIDGTAFDRELMDRVGAKYQLLNADELRQLEPGLSREFAHGLFQPEALFASTPYALSQAYLRCILARGGRLVTETVRRFEFGPQGPTKVVTDLGMHPVDRVVVAAGAWSKPLARQLGHSVPLDTERGYHLNFPWSERTVLNRPVLFGGENFVLCPMRDGIRMTGGVELAGLDAPPDFRRIRALVPAARRVLPGLSGEATREWLGFRPSIPDSKPVVARSSKWSNAYFAFGHGHMGLGLSAITGKLIADLVAERPSEIPMAPYAADRF